ncbi:MAG: hypothetical protein R8P61_35550 [Bacteroidia bacterium]|nr:hypothetical protein [Bacteroidia bacterium]
MKKLFPHTSPPIASPILIYIFCISLFASEIQAQVEPAGEWASIEVEVSYFGEMMWHPGAQIGVNFPYTERSVAREKESKKRGTYFVERKRQFIFGGNVAAYVQPNNHFGLLTNAEIGYRSLKTKSFKPEKIKFWELDLGLGLYHYELAGKTFVSTESGFEEIKGHGTAFMPSFSISSGRSLRISSLRLLWFNKISAAWEIPFNIGSQYHFIFQSGFAIPLKENKSRK